MLRRISVFGFLILYICAAAIFSLLAGCGDTTAPDEPEDGPATLSVSPAKGSFGTVVSLEGVDTSSLDASSLRLIVQGAESRVTQTPSGNLLAPIPVIFGGDGDFAAPPTDAVDIKLFSDDKLIAVATSAFTVLPLPIAPGAANEAVDLLSSIATALQDVSLALIVEPSIEQAYAMALPGAVEELLNGSDERSLASQLDALERNTDGGLELVEGLIAGSGLLDQLEVVAGMMSSLGVQARGITASENGKMTLLTQTDLAVRMQLYVMAHDIGQQVIGETNSTWSMWVATFVSGASLVGLGSTVLAPAAPAVAIAGTIGTILGLVNFAIDKVALAHLPSRIDSFDLIVNDPQIAAGEVPDTEIWIHASNNPPSITILDMVNLVLTGMGLLPGETPSGHPRRVALIQGVEYLLSVMRGILSGYAGAHANIGLDADAASIPHMSWRAEITDIRFVSPKSLTPSIIDATGAGILAWRAQLGASGEGRIYATINSGPTVTSLPQIPGYTYQAGAFGEDIRATPTRTVTVGGEPRLVVNFPERVELGVATEMTAQVVGSAGEYQICFWDIVGSVSENCFTSTGELVRTMVSFDSDENGPEILVRASGPGGVQIEKTVFAYRPDEIIIVDRSSLVSADAVYAFGDFGTSGTTVYNVSELDVINHFDSYDQSIQVESTGSGGGSNATGSAEASETSSVSLTGNNFSGASFSGTASASASLSAPVSSFDSWISIAEARSNLTVKFRVWGKDASFQLSMNLDEDCTGLLAGPGLNICYEGSNICEDDSPWRESVLDSSRSQFNGALQGGGMFRLSIQCRARVSFSNNSTPDFGNGSNTGSADATLSVSHPGPSGLASENVPGFR